MTGRSSTTPGPEASARHVVVRAAGVALCLFVAAEVNYPQLRPQSELAIFSGLGLLLCFLVFPLHVKIADRVWARAIDWLEGLLALAVSAYVVVQTEPAFTSWWLDGRSLGDRAGVEPPLDYAIGVVGLLLVLDGARRAVGWALPSLALLFLAYAHWGSVMPDWLFPHRGYGWERIVAQTFLHGQGVFGVALKVMFTYVFLFVLFGAFLERTGATRWVIHYARKMLGDTAGGPAKVAILSSGLMGSLSGSAVANTATTGTFTIPLMRSAGFSKRQAAGIEAAASSGGALVPPVMGAGAYMMLEIVSPPVTILQILKAALLPAILYYLSLFLIAHFTALHLAASGATTNDDADDLPSDDGPTPGWLEGTIFAGSLGVLIVLLLFGFTVFRSVSVAMLVTLVLAAISPTTRLGPKRILQSLDKAARGGVALVAAAASVGVVLGVVTLTGVGSKLPATIIPLAEQNLFLALVLIMVSSIVLGMGLPSAVCYLLLATLIGPALMNLGVVPLAAHLFIFYFGLMSMVTPPVALAAYTAASIADSKIMATAFAAFRFALVGFALPFLFVYRPQLLMLTDTGDAATWWVIALAFATTAIGIVPLSAAISGYFGRDLSPLHRGLLLLVAIALFAPTGSIAGGLPISWLNLAGGLALGATWWLLRRHEPTEATA